MTAGVGAAERPELEQEAGEPGRLGGDLPQRRPGRAPRTAAPRRRSSPQCSRRVRVERVADRAEQPGDEAGAEEHEDRDSVRGRRSGRPSRAARARRRSRRRRRARCAGTTMRSGHQSPGQAGDHHRCGVDGDHVRRADRDRTEPAREQSSVDAADRAHDQRLQQPALGIAAHHAERQEDREHDARGRASRTSPGRT